MSMTILIASLIALAFGLAGLIADRLTKPTPEPERKPEPFTSRQFKADEIAYLVHQIAIHDAIHPINPANYHDSTQHSIERWVSDRTGRRFQMTSKDWFHIARAWYVSRDQGLYARCDELKQRLSNI